MVVLVSQGCHKKQAKTGWIKTTDIHRHTGLEVKSLKLRCQQGYAVSEGTRGGLLGAPL